MKVRRLILFAVFAMPTLAVIALAATLLVPTSSAQDCYNFTEDSYIQSSDGCGSVEYDLAVKNLGTYTDTDFGYWWSYGSCYSSYYDCDNNYVDQGYFQAGKSYYDDGPVGNYAEDFHWMLDDYVVTGYESCGNGNPDDEIMQYVNDQFSTGEQEAYNTCF